MNERIWIIGIGYWSSVLIPKIQDIFPEHTIELIDKVKFNTSHILNNLTYGIKDLNYFMENNVAGDIVFLLTPPKTHFEIIKFSLIRKLNIWSEKPLTTNFVEAQFLLELADQMEVCLFVDDTFLYDPLIANFGDYMNFNEIKIIKSQRHAWGKILPDGGVVWDLLCHDFSIMSHFGLTLNEIEVLDVIFIELDSDAKVPVELKLRAKSSPSLKRIDISLSCISRTKIREIVFHSKNQLISYESIGATSRYTITDNLTIPGLGVTEITRIHNNMVEPISQALLDFKSLILLKRIQGSLAKHVENIQMIESVHLKIFSI
jgi:predicted dehydrogenase